MLCFGSSGAAAQEERGTPLPEGDGRQLVATVCSQCHGLRETQILREGQKGWEEIVDRMVLYGAQLSPAEADRVTRYLATQLGPGSSLMPSGPASGSGRRDRRPQTFALPAGPGKDLVAARCILCHDLGRIVSVPRSKADWTALTTNMLRGLGDTSDEVRTMIFYLQANFSGTMQAHSSIAQAHSSTTQAFLASAQAEEKRADPHSDSAEQTGPAGKDVFARKCALCHSVLPDQARLGPSLFGEMREPHPRMTEGQVRSIVKNGRGAMPPFQDVLSEADTDALLAYLRSL